MNMSTKLTRAGLSLEVVGIMLICCLASLALKITGQGWPQHNRLSVLVIGAVLIIPALALWLKASGRYALLFPAGNRRR